MELHEAKARHAAQKLTSRNHRYGATAATGVHNPVVGGHRHHHGVHDPAVTGTGLGAPPTAAVTGAPAPVQAYPPTVTQYPAAPGHHII